MNELITEMQRLEGANQELEAEALACEQRARQHRAKRAENKQRLAELRAMVADAKLVHAAQGAAAQAAAARQEAEVAKTEAHALVDALKQKAAELDQLIGEARAVASPDLEELDELEEAVDVEIAEAAALAGEIGGSAPAAAGGPAIADAAELGPVTRTNLAD